MKAIILAAGLGSRLGILGKTIPKCLIKINGKFLLERQIDLLNNSGIDDITIVIGSYGECWTEKNKNIIKNIIKKVVINPENYKTNNTHSLKLALNKDNEEEILVLDGDLLCTNEVIEKIKDSNYTTIVSKKISLDAPGNKVKTDDADFVIEFSRETSSEFIYGGVFKIISKDLSLFNVEINKEEYYSVDLGYLFNNLAKKIKIKNIVENGWVNVNEMESLGEAEGLSKKNKNFVAIMSGYTAVGKSTSARKISRGMNCDLFHSAVVRKELDLSPKTLEEQDQLFDFRTKKREEMDKKVYAKLAEKARESLSSGRNVVIDAGYFFQWQRKLIYEQAKRFGAEVIIIRVLCNNENEIKKRLDGRAKKFGIDPLAETPSWNAYLASKEITEVVEKDSTEIPLKIIEYDPINKNITLKIGEENQNINKIIQVLNHKIMTQDGDMNLTEINDASVFELVKSKFVLALDFDGVITSPYKLKTEYINQELKRRGQNIRIEEKVSSRDDCLKLGIPVEIYDEASIRAYTERPEILPLTDGFLEVFKKIKELPNIAIFIVTSRYASMLKHLEEYLRYHNIKIQGIIHTENKNKRAPLNMLGANIFVDDTLSKVKELLNGEKNFSETGKIILFRNVSNEDHPGMREILETWNWNELYNLIIKEYNKVIKQR